MIDDSQLAAPFERMIANLCPPAQVRAVECGGSAAAMWREIEDSGFLDALLPPAAGGAGLALADIFPLVTLLGSYAVPLPIAETMVARAILCAAGQAIPAGAIALASARPGQSVTVPNGMTAQHILCDDGDQLGLAVIADCEPTPTGVAYSLAARIRCGAGAHFARPASGLRPIAATIRAAQIAGAADRVLAMSVDYANQRIQFGKPIAKQQALQQNLAVMAEHGVAVRLAAQLAFETALWPRVAAAAAAKIAAGEAATTIAASAHAVHGAIGISEAFDLQLFTRRLHEWRLADGGDSYWAQRLGTAHLVSSLATVDFARHQMFGDD